MHLLPFARAYAVDFEFRAPPGERPEPICCVTRDLYTGETLYLSGEDLRSCPYPTDGDSLIVAYYSSAEWTCHGVLGWPMPERVLDLYAEFRWLTNGKQLPAGRGLLGALAYSGLDGIDAHHKDVMRDLAMRGGPYTPDEMRRLLVYCESDVDACERLLEAMLPEIDLERALLRGRYMVAAARMELAGVPIDLGALAQLRDRWERLKWQIVASVDRDYGVFDGSVFREEWFASWLARSGIPWPVLPSGKLMLDDDTFREQAKLHPIVNPIREARLGLSQLRLADLAVGVDGRNRCLLSAFASKTGRNQPSNSRFIFGPSVWLRHLIQPAPSRGLAYVDWSQQEFGIAAALSGDANMCAAYTSGDPYLTFAKQAGAVPPDGTKGSHPTERDQFKICALAVQYGMGEWALGKKIGKSEAAGRELLRLHRQTFPVYWRWVESAQACGFLLGKLWTVFGWRYFTQPDTKAKTLANFPMQGNGAEMLRLACSLATERGIAVCAPVHDALLIEAPLPELDQAVAATQAAMAEASRVVLSGFELRSDAKLIRHPERYSDPRGERMWGVVQELLAGNLATGGDPTSPRAARYLATGGDPSNLLSTCSSLLGI